MLGGPIDALSKDDIQHELRTYYGVEDFADCIEKSDLDAKLLHFRTTKLATCGLQYGPLLTAGNARDPSGVVTLAHGLGDSAYGWADVGEELARRLPHLLFLLPTAPQRAVTINMGMSMPAWYDIRAPISGALRSGRQDAEGVRVSAAYLASLARVHTVRFAVPPTRVLYAGFSQGAATSLVTGLLAAQAPAGIAVMSGYLAAAAELIKEVRNTSVQVAMFHGRQDPVVPIAAARETKALLESEGRLTHPVEFREYNMQHTAVPEEVDHLEAFIRRVLPPLDAGKL